MARLSTIAAFGFDAFNPPAQLRLYRQMGCRSCQFYRNEQNPPTHTDARRIAEDAGLPFDSVHGLFGPAYDPSSPDEPTRRATIDVYRREGDLAIELDSRMIVVHPASLAQPGDDRSEATRHLRVTALRRSLDDLAAIGRSLGVTYLVENVPDNYLLGSDPAQLAQFIRDAASPHVRMCFDTGHAHMTGSASPTLRQCLDVVSYLHITDNNGQVDSHTIPGQGTIDWQALADPIRQLPGDTPAMLELFETEQSLRDQLANNLPQRLEAWLSLA